MARIQGATVLACQPATMLVASRAACRQRYCSVPNAGKSFKLVRCKKSWPLVEDRKCQKGGLERLSPARPLHYCNTKHIALSTAKLWCCLMLCCVLQSDVVRYCLVLCGDGTVCKAHEQTGDHTLTRQLAPGRRPEDQTARRPLVEDRKTTAKAWSASHPHIQCNMQYNTLWCRAECCTVLSCAVVRCSVVHCCVSCKHVLCDVQDALCNAMP